jgi:3-deoxy-manno-octulosonate cytidylyltransferase (CMP-KDO synthetase)
MILHVIERVLMSRSISRTIVATDDDRILNVVERAGFEAMMTSGDHPSGSDRLAEVVSRLGEIEFVVNIQGDEPLISPETVDRVATALLAEEGAGIITVSEPILECSDVLNPDVVKVVTDSEGKALYFSRSPVPYPREAARQYGGLENALKNDPDLLRVYRKHTGIYGFGKKVLFEYVGCAQSRLECAESLEQLRALENGIRITVIEAAAPTIGVDTLDDLEKVRGLYHQSI